MSIYKIISVGNSKVGKTSISRCLSNHIYHEKYIPTIAIELYIKKMKIDDINYKLELWDLSGQDKYKSLLTPYYRIAHAILLTYDITNKESFDDLEKWMNEIGYDSTKQSSPVIFLIGNKEDLEQKREVTSNDALQFMSKYGITLHTECSVKQNINMDTILYSLMDKLMLRTKLGYISMERVSSRNIIMTGASTSANINDEQKCCNII